MSAAQPAAGGLDRRQITRALFSSTIGNAIEYYDFGVYGLAASLYLGKLFFPSGNPLTSTLVAFTTFWLGFVSRPLGGLIFGHFGDRIGRKRTLIVTLLLMGTATALVAFVPTYAQVGIWGGVALTLLRLLQGVAVGGEWGGSVLLTLEWANRSRWRGALTAFPMAGAPLGGAFASLAMRLSTGGFGPNSYWGWRFPFVLSIVLVAVGLYIRLGIKETPVFSRLLQERRTARAPVVAVLRQAWHRVLLLALMRTGQQGITFIIGTFILTYGTLVLHLPQTQVLTWVVIGSFLELASVPFWGMMGDRIGRRRTLLIGAAAMLVLAIPYWLMLDTRMPVFVAAAILLGLLVQDIQFGPQAAFIPETFTGRLRYSGSSLSYQLSAGLVGGIGPIIATGLLQTFHSSMPIAFYMIACTLVSIGAILFLKDNSTRDLSVEYEEERAPAARVVGVSS